MKIKAIFNIYNFISYKLVKKSTMNDVAEEGLEPPTPGL